MLVSLFLFESLSFLPGSLEQAPASRPDRWMGGYGFGKTSSRRKTIGGNRRRALRSEGGTDAASRCCCRSAINSRKRIKFRAVPYHWKKRRMRYPTFGAHREGDILKKSIFRNVVLAILETVNAPNAGSFLLSEPWSFSD